jgi:type II secretory pathway pseudopilin PulG
MKFGLEVTVESRSGALWCPTQVRDAERKVAPFMGKWPSQALKSAQAGNGFSLLELLVSITVLMVIASAVLSVMSSYQKTYQTTQLRADMYLSLRGVSELMAQEIGQAGLFGLPPATIVPAVTPNLAPQVVTVSSVAAMFVGEKILVDQGPAQELITLTAVNPNQSQITAVFTNPHPAGVALNVQGVFPSGIMTTSTTSKLQLFGDLNGDGTLVFVHYDCNPSTAQAVVPGTLTRSITPYTPTVTTSNTPDTLLSTLIVNPPPASRPCFQYTTPPAINGYTIVTNVAVTLSLRSTVMDPVTHAYLVMTKSFMDLTPRNLLGAVELANIPAVNLLQVTPPHYPLN